jgi:hypothetical protein
MAEAKVKPIQFRPVKVTEDTDPEQIKEAKSKGLLKEGADGKPYILTAIAYEYTPATADFEE